MIRTVSITDFKCFRHLDIELARLSVLTGKNSSGKSSLIQALLLARLAEVSKSTAIPLNGLFDLGLGEAADVLNSEAAASSFRIALGREGVEGSVEYVFDVPPDRSSYVSLGRRDGPPWPELGAAGRAFTYLSGERLGPRDSFATSSANPDEATVGPRGEFAAHLLAILDRVEVPEARRHPETQERGGLTTVHKQLEFWLQEILEPVEVMADWVPGSEVTLLRYKSPGVRTDWVRPGNFGFGFSYVLPVILAALTAEPEGILLIENPEGHLHPEGQSALGAFLALVAAGGLQIVVETHSDHVLNGVRRAITANRAPMPEDVAMLFFSSDGAAHSVRRLGVTATGAMTEWPRGFFDQIEVDLAEISKARVSDR